MKEKHFKLSRALSLFCVALFAVALILFFVYVLLPQVVRSLGKLVDKLPAFISSVFDLIKKILERVDVEADYVSGFSAAVLAALQSLFDSALKMTPDLMAFGKTAAAVFSDAFFSLTFAGYLLADKEGMGRRFDKSVDAAFSESFAYKIKRITREIVEQFDNFFSGQIIEAVILGFMCFVGMLIFDIPYAPLVSGIVAITAIVPLLGAIIGTVPSAIIILIDSPTKAVVFLVFIIALQILEGNLIYPHVVGNKVELPAFVVLLALLIGGGLFGVYGILICVPVTSVIYKLVSEKVNERKRRKVLKIDNVSKD